MELASGSFSSSSSDPKGGRLSVEGESEVVEDTGVGVASSRIFPKEAVLGTTPTTVFDTLVKAEVVTTEFGFITSRGGAAEPVNYTRILSMRIQNQIINFLLYY